MLGSATIPVSIRRGRRAAAALAVLAAAVMTFVGPTAASATPPAIPSKATAQAQLNALTVAIKGSMSGYSRDLFPHWITVSGSCDTGEQVLKRDGTSVVVNSSCQATSGPVV